jgi:hypothetical protein
MYRLDSVCKSLMVLAVACSFAAKLAAADNPGQDCQRIGYTANNNKIQISGLVYGQKYFGPPGYGETPKVDEKHTALILKLDDPLRVYRAASEAEKAGILVVKEIQLAGKIPDGDLIGQHVVATGELYGWFSGYHKRPILIAADLVRPGGRIACDGSEQPLKN